MATEQETAPAYDAGQKYRVRVSRPISMGPFRYLPRTEFEAEGDFLNQIVEEHGADAVGTAEPI